MPKTATLNVPLVKMLFLEPASPDVGQICSNGNKASFARSAFIPGNLFHRNRENGRVGKAQRLAHRVQLRAAAQIGQSHSLSAEGLKRREKPRPRGAGGLRNLKNLG